MVGTPGNAVGIPAHYYILSNNHVLANSNNATPGDAVLQPGPFDGGTDPADRIASLSRFIPITFDPPVPRVLHRNLLDAPVASCAFPRPSQPLSISSKRRTQRRATHPLT